MKCIRCKRPLTAAAQTIPTQDGMAWVGPVCARIMGLTAPDSSSPAGSTRKRRRPRARKPAPGQLPLEL